MAEAREIAERIRNSVKEGAGLTVSLGISVYREDMKDREEIIKEADDALYRAKQNGRNRVEVMKAEIITARWAAMRLRAAGSKSDGSARAGSAIATPSRVSGAGPDAVGGGRRVTSRRGASMRERMKMGAAHPGARTGFRQRTRGVSAVSA